MYKELLLFPESLRGQTVYPDVARKIVALACDGTNVNPAIFNRDSEGKTLQDRFPEGRRNLHLGKPPLIMFDGGQGFIRIYGIGNAGANLLMDEMGPLVSALNRHFDGVMRMELKEGTCSLRMSEPIIYNIRRLVIAKKTEQLDHFWQVSAVDRAIEIRREVMRGLVSMARTLDEDAGEGDMLEWQIPNDESATFDVLEGESVPVEIKPGVPAAAFKNLVFCTNLDIVGPWAVGKLRSRGYGIIRRRIGQ